jgi:DNA-binding NarL/FixJ family response regulator
VCSVGSAANPSECGNAAKKSSMSTTLEKKMEVIRRKEDGQTRPDVCRSMKLLPSTVSTVIKNAYGMKQAVRHAATVHATQVNYFRNKLLQKWRNYCHKGG